MKSEWCSMNMDWCGQSAWVWLRLDRKGIFVVIIIIIQCASLHDGHAGLEMGSPSSPLLKPFRGLLPSYCAKGEPICNHLPLHNKWEEDSKVISQHEKNVPWGLLYADILLLMLESYNNSKATDLLSVGTKSIFPARNQIMCSHCPAPCVNKICFLKLSLLKDTWNIASCISLTFLQYFSCEADIKLRKG